MSAAIINIVLMTFMALTAIAIARLRNLFAVVMLAGIFSFLGATVFVLLDAVDVAFTEAAVGAGISTVLALGTLALIRTEVEKSPRHRPWLPLAVVVVTGAALIFAVSGLPPQGDPRAPAQQHVAPRYLQQSGEEIGIPNVVTSVLASYRGYDTLGETGVIFTAGVAVMILLAGYRRRRWRAPRGQDEEAP